MNNLTLVYVFVDDISRVVLLKPAFESEETLHSLAIIVRVCFCEASLQSTTKEERFASFATMNSATSRSTRCKTREHA